jgi:hypothetical protein
MPKCQCSCRIDRTCGRHMVSADYLVRNPKQILFFSRDTTLLINSTLERFDFCIYDHYHSCFLLPKMKLTNVKLAINTLSLAWAMRGVTADAGQVREYHPSLLICFMFFLYAPHRQVTPSLSLAFSTDVFVESSAGRPREGEYHPSSIRTIRCDVLVMP